jgi:hypothetical protein
MTDDFVRLLAIVSCMADEIENEADQLERIGSVHSSIERTTKRLRSFAKRQRDAVGGMTIQVARSRRAQVAAGAAP